MCKQDEAEKLKILIVVPAYYPAERFGGPIRSIHSLAKGLVNIGFDVTVFATNSNGAEDLSVAVGVPTPLEGVKVCYFQVERPRSYFYSPSLGRAVRDSATSFDLIYTAWMYVYTTAVAAKECIRQGVPYMISPRGMLDRNAVAQKSRFKKHAYLALTGRRQLILADSVHFTSRRERENAVIEFDRAKTLVVANGIELNTDARDDPKADLSGMGIPGDGPFVLFLGRLSYIKGLDLLSQAWPEVLRAVPSCHLVIAGPDDENLYDPMHEGFVRAGIAQSVSYLGMVGPEMKIQLLRRCTLLASPSYLESFGMSIVEAMAEGKPVVVTDRVNIAEDIAEAGAGLVTRCDPAEIAGAIVDLVSNTARSVAMGAKGRMLVQDQYLLGTATKKMAQAMSSIVERRKATQSIQ